MIVRKRGISGGVERQYFLGPQATRSLIVGGYGGKQMLSRTLRPAAGTVQSIEMSRNDRLRDAGFEQQRNGQRCSGLGAAKLPPLTGFHVRSRPIRGGARIDDDLPAKLTVTRKGCESVWAAEPPQHAETGRPRRSPRCLAWSRVGGGVAVFDDGRGDDDAADRGRSVVRVGVEAVE
jgi:hypothetical protein